MHLSFSQAPPLAGIFQLLVRPSCSAAEGEFILSRMSEVAGVPVRPTRLERIAPIVSSSPNESPVLR